jgi:hypothetical protein
LDRQPGVASILRALPSHSLPADAASLLTHLHTAADSIDLSPDAVASGQTLLFGRALLALARARDLLPPDSLHIAVARRRVLAARLHTHLPAGRHAEARLLAGLSPDASSAAEAALLALGAIPGPKAVSQVPRVLSSSSALALPPATAEVAVAISELLKGPCTLRDAASVGLETADIAPPPGVHLFAVTRNPCGLAQASGAVGKASVHPSGIPLAFATAAASGAVGLTAQLNAAACPAPDPSLASASAHLLSVGTAESENDLPASVIPIVSVPSVHLMRDVHACFDAAFDVIAEMEDVDIPVNTELAPVVASAAASAGTGATELAAYLTRRAWPEPSIIATLRTLAEFSSQASGLPVAEASRLFGRSFSPAEALGCLVRVAGWDEERILPASSPDAQIPFATATELGSSPDGAVSPELFSLVSSAILGLVHARPALSLTSLPFHLPDLAPATLARVVDVLLLDGSVVARRSPRPTKVEGVFSRPELTPADCVFCIDGLEPDVFLALGRNYLDSAVAPRNRFC